MTVQSRRVHHIVAAAVFLVLPALGGGCLAVDAHHLPNSYYKLDGMWCGDFGIGLVAARVATRMTLGELKMPISQEAAFGPSIFMDTRTPEGFEARFIITPLGPQLTRIGCRIGGFGTHREVCERLLNQISTHLDAVRHFDAAPPAPAAPARGFVGPPPTPDPAPPSPAPSAQQSPTSQPTFPPPPSPVGK